MAENNSTQNSSTSHHHHHHSSDNKKKKRKDETALYRKRMFTHVERMLFIRRWSFAILCIIAAFVLAVVVFVYTVE